MFKTLSLPILLLTLASCSTSKSYLPLNTGYPSKPAGCKLDIYTPSNKVTKEFELIGELDVSDSGFSINCGPEQVMKSIRNMACSKGADAIFLYNTRHASQSLSTCFQTSAKFLVYK